MGKKKTFYFSDEDMLVHDKAKRYANELSPIVVKGLRAFVEAKEREELGMQEVVLFIGKTVDANKVEDGKMIKFTALELARDREDFSSSHFMTTILYYTKKGKYLVFREQVDNFTIYTEYFIREDVQELFKDQLPEALVNAAVANSPELAIEELDV